MSEIHAGALLDRPPGPKYLEALSFAELAPAEPLPKAATLRRWAEGLPATFTRAFVVPKAARRSQAGAFRMDAAAEDALLWSLEAADILDARFIVVPTGPELTTGQRDRDRFSEWLERWRGQIHAGTQKEREIVWHPGGLWDPELAFPFATRSGLLWAFDPLQSDLLPPGPDVYARLRALGARSRFDETSLLEILDALLQTEADHAWVALESPRSFREARRLSELAASEDPAAF